MRIRTLFFCVAAMVGAMGDCPAVESVAAGAIPIAAFQFELEDATPAANLVGKKTSSDESLQKVTAAAREQLAGSGRYTIVSVDDVDAQPVKDHTLRNCDGCEAAIAHSLRAQQSMIGIVQRATQTDYYIMVAIRDAVTGKLLNSQGANFAGSEEGWATGVRMLIKHQVLVQ